MESDVTTAGSRTDHPRPSQNDDAIYWSLCISCEKVTAEKLICPSKSTGKDYDSGYRKFARNICCLQQLDNMPMGINVSWLDDGRGVADTLLNGYNTSHVLQSFRILK